MKEALLADARPNNKYVLIRRTEQNVRTNPIPLSDTSYGTVVLSHPFIFVMDIEFDTNKIIFLRAKIVVHIGFHLFLTFLV